MDFKGSGLVSDLWSAVAISKSKISRDDFAQRSCTSTLFSMIFFSFFFKRTFKVKDQRECVCIFSSSTKDVEKQFAFVNGICIQFKVTFYLCD